MSNKGTLNVTTSVKESYNPASCDILYVAMEFEFKHLVEKIPFYESERSFNLHNLTANFIMTMSCVNFNPPITAFLTKENAGRWLDDYCLQGIGEKEKQFITQSILYAGVAVSISHPEEFRKSVNEMVSSLKSVASIDNQMVTDEVLMIWSLIQFKRFVTVHFEKSLNKLGSDA